MAWTTTRTWVTGELVTAAIMNTYIRDAMAYVVDRKVTSKTVNTTTTETDLLNGEITVAASALGASRALRLTARGDCGVP